MLGRILDGLRSKIVDPNVICHSPAVTLPCPELTKDAIIGQFPIIRRERAESPSRQRNLLRQPSIHGSQKKLSVKGIPLHHPRTEDDMRIVILPGHDNVVRPHPVPDKIPAKSRGVSQPFGNSTLTRNEIHLTIPVVFSCKSDMFPIR